MKTDYWHQVTPRLLLRFPKKVTYFDPFSRKSEKSEIFFRKHACVFPKKWIHFRTVCSHSFWNSPLDCFFTIRTGEMCIFRYIGKNSLNRFRNIFKTVIKTISMHIKYILFFYNIITFLKMQIYVIKHIYSKQTIF